MGKGNVIKVFVSQPEEAQEVRDEIFSDIEGILNLDPEKVVREIPSYMPETRSQTHPLYGLGASIQLLSQADVAIFAPGWEEARECRIEHECAVQYGIPSIDMSGTQ